MALQVAPAALFGAAVAFATATLLATAPSTAEPLAAGAAAFIAAWAALRLFGDLQDPFPVRQFDPAFLEPEFVETPQWQDRAALTDQQPLPASASDKQEPSELLLTDALPGLRSESRVVHLFQAGTVPTAGQLHAHIEQHLRSNGRPAMPDATEALHEALAALRRSLR